MEALMNIHLAALPALALLAMPVAAQLNEHAFLGDLPTIYSVTRLPTAQADTPGAVTVLDREMIRRSGAREVTDLLRLVPGYLTGGLNGAGPSSSYHAGFDEYGGRQQVFIDGRSVYSTYMFADTHRGTMSLLLEDIERIEVLRGTNSATFGGSAMLGVINIVTRHAADSEGGAISLTAGQGDTRDLAARYGWQSQAGAYRISLGSRNDSGYLNAYDDKRLNQVHFRGDLTPSAGSELMVAVGTSDLKGGDGFADQPGRPLRTIGWQDSYGSLRWRRSLDAGSELTIAANTTEERYDDRFNHSALPGVVVDYSGTGRRHNIEFQYASKPHEQVRTVWGIGASHDSASSIPLYAQPEVSFDRQQLFGNLEWRPDPRWVINAGGMVERHSEVGSEVAPRLAVNYHFMPEHTLRLSATRGFRMPSPFELRSDVRFYVGDIQVGRTFLARGNISAERADTLEIGYLGEFRAQRMTVDVRIFEERMGGLVKSIPYNVQPSLPVTRTAAVDFVNRFDYTISGLEYQWHWKPQEGLDITANQSFLRSSCVFDPTLLYRTPGHIGTLAVVKQLPNRFELSGTLSAVDAMSWFGTERIVGHTTRLDLRLAQRFMIGANPAEAALTVHAVNGEYSVFEPLRKFMVERRAFLTLRMDF
jgi:iron complex outermembrane receptor protein